MTSVYFINPPDLFLEKRGDRLPLGLLYLSSYVKQFNVNTEIWDLNHDNNDDIYNYIEVHTPDYICISVAVTSYKWTIEFIKKVKSKNFKGKIIGGGNHITNIALDKEPQEHFDYLVIGDGELALRNIIDNNPKEKVIMSNDVEDLDSLPFPDYEGIRMSNYKMTVDGRKGTSLVASRGCFFSCAYCGSAKIHKVRARSPQNILREMKLLYSKYDIRGFYFGDDIFTHNFKKTIELCELIKQNFDTNEIAIRVTTRSTLLNKEVCGALKHAGVTIVSIGLESGNEKILQNINKGETLEQQRKGVELCHDAGLKVKGFFIIGLPGETKETALDTINFAKSLNIAYADCYPLTPYPNTPLWDNPEKYNIKIIKPIDGNWDEYFQIGRSGVNHDLKIIHPNLSNDEIKELVNLFNKEVKKPGMTY